MQSHLILPNYEWWDGPFYGAGLKVYDLLAGKLGLGPSRHLSKEETLKRIPTLEPKRLRGGVIYQDGQFDDSRLAVNLAQTMNDQGGLWSRPKTWKAPPPSAGITLSWSPSPAW